jgi:hypothetical protein
MKFPADSPNSIADDCYYLQAELLSTSPEQELQELKSKHSTWHFDCLRILQRESSSGRGLALNI